jgi:hypothetical protein
MGEIQSMNLNLKISEAIQKNNLVLFYLYAEQYVSQPYLNFSRAFKDQLINVSENGDKAHVQLINVENKADQKVLILNGEQLTGNKLKQNRIVAKTTILGSNQLATIEVRCGEQKRWSPVMNNELNVPDSMFFSRGDLASQKNVWKKIGDKLDLHNIKSFTMSADEVYQKRNLEVNTMVDSFQLDPQAIGIALGTTHELLSVDIFSDPEIFKAYFKKILRGFVTNNLKNINKKTTLVQKDVYTFLRWIDEADKYPIGNLKGNLGEKFSLKGMHVVGNVLYEEKEVVHCSAFVNINLKEFPESDKDYKVA